MPRREAVIHRLRLGYRCNWEINVCVPKACDHCYLVEELLHYILECLVLNKIRPPQSEIYHIHLLVKRLD